MTQPILDELNLKAQTAIDHLHNEFAKIQTGRANAALVENVMVDSYGVKVQLRSVASITIPEFKQIAIQPYSRDQLTNIEKAIKDANLGINPQNDGIVIRLNIPPLTEDRRKDLVKLVHKLAEDGRISIRNARHDALNALKALEKEKEISEDELHSKEKLMQEKVDSFNAQIEEILKKKEKDVMTV
jgi:ribosome recycling factor